MERITVDEAVQMLEHFTGKRYQIGTQREKSQMRIEYPKRYMRKSEILAMRNPLLGENGKALSSQRSQRKTASLRCELSGAIKQKVKNIKTRNRRKINENVR